MTRKRTLSDDAAELDDRYITSLARGIQVLGAFSADAWLTHGELVRRTGLAQATISRITFTLTHLGYLDHRSETGTYSLSGAVLSLGFRMLSQFDIGIVARPHMQELADDIGIAVALGTRSGSDVVYLSVCRGTSALGLGIETGSRLPAIKTALGKAILCSASAREREGFVRRNFAEELQAEARRTLDDTMQELKTLGCIVSEREWHPQVSSVGVPLVIHDRHPLAFGVGGLASDLPKDKLVGIGQRLKAIATEVAREIHHEAYTRGV